MQELGQVLKRTGLAEQTAEMAGTAAAAGSQRPSTRENPLAVVARWWWIVVVCSGASLGAAYLYLSKTVPTYASASRVFIEESKPRIIANGQLDLVGRSASYLEQQCELIQSAPVLQLAVESPSVKAIPAFAGVADPIGRLKAGLTVVVGKNDVLTIACVSTDPQEAAGIANAAVEGYTAYLAQESGANVEHVLAILRKEKETREVDLREARERLKAYNRTNAALILDTHRSALLEKQLEDLSARLITCRTELLQVEAAYNNALRAERDPAGRARWSGTAAAGGVPSVEEVTLQRVREALSIQQQSLASMRRNYGPNNPAVQTAEARLEELRAQAIEAEKAVGEAEGRAFSKYHSLVERQLQDKRAELQELESQYETSSKTAIEVRARVGEYVAGKNELEGVVKRAEGLCDSADERIKAIAATPDGSVPTIRVLERALPFFAAVAPQRPKVWSIAGIVGLLVGVGLAFGRDWMDERLRSSKEVSDSMVVPVLGMLPRMGRPDLRAIGQKVLLEPSSDAAEAFRAIRTGLYFTRHNRASKTVLITSPTPGDGKSVVTSNLGISLALAGRRTLIVDADFRRPSQHRIFGLNPAVGLSNVIVGGTRLKEAIYKSNIPGLHLLPCGQIPSNPSELIDSERFVKLLDALSASYDRILVDSPPVMPVTDARILGALCDVSILVLRAGKSTRTEATAARDALLSVGAEIQGVIVNGVTRGNGAYYYAGDPDQTDRNGHSSGAAPGASIAARRNGKRLAPDGTIVPAPEMEPSGS